METKKGVIDTEANMLTLAKPILKIPGVFYDHSVTFTTRE